MNQPLVSIIIIQYNRSDEIQICIESILAQNYPNYRLLIIDNASTDESLSVLKKLYSQKAIIIENQNNLGYTGGVNIGIKKAIELGSKYIYLLNNDMFLKEDTLSNLVSYAINHTQGGAFGSVVFEMEDKIKLWSAGGKVNKWFCTTSHLKIKNNHSEAEVDYIPGTSVLYNLDVLKKIGCFDDRFFLYWEDVDIGTRIKNNNFKNIIIYNSIAYHKCGSSHGRYNEITTYYPIRNQLLYAQIHLKGITKWFFYTTLPFHFTMKITAIVLGKVFFNRENAFNRLKMVYKSYFDYFKSRYGKAQIH